MRFERPIPWSVLGCAMVLPTVVTVLYFVILAGYDPWLQRAAYGTGKAIQFGLPAFWIFAVLRQRPAWRLPDGRGLFSGTVFGLAVLLAMVGLYAWLKPSGVLDPAMAEIRAKVVDMGLQTPVAYASLGVFYALIHSFLEEYYWRWFVFGGLRTRTTATLAVVVAAVAFMAHHVLVLATFFGWGSPWTWVFSLSVAIGGGVWAWLYERAGTLYGVWLSHLIVDAAIFLVGYDMVSEILQ
jgi:membrane protease YdiL (CAAX protease family)